jgi:hypothetical protein
MLPLSFFAPLHSPDEVERFKKINDDNIKTYIEMRGASYIDVMLMPYPFFVDDLKWKLELEEKKRKEIEDQQRKNKEDSYNKLKRKNLENKARRR